MKQTSPATLTIEHDFNSFSCGQTMLDEWLKKRALPNQSTGASRTFVVANELKQVMGYYALASGAVTHQEATRAIRQNMPDPIPVMVLGRLAVDLRAQGQKLGSAMLQDALQRCAMVSQNAGVRALLVHALNETARQFYEHYGFKALAAHPRTLMMRV